MRLTTSQVSCIRDGVAKYFGSTSHVWLFGSRLDDQLRGGDIDLYIEPEVQDPALLVDAKLKFLREMHRQMGEQKIDVVLRRTAFQQELPIHRIAKENGKQLL
jgi:hypothetical protein